MLITIDFFQLSIMYFGIGGEANTGRLNLQPFSGITALLFVTMSAMPL